MKPSKINFEKIAHSLGVNVQQATVSLSIPPFVEEGLHYRAFCIAELLMEVCDRPQPLHNQWAEVKRVLNHSDLETIVMIQFNALPQFFPLVLANKYLFGNRDAVVMNIRKVERQLYDLQKAWLGITVGGNKRFDHVQDLLDLMKIRINNKIKSNIF
ncbi:hypothetical protein [Paenibacillus periandrae]|uniref:hypothetical protein n=1 Tax=Paenibacillus periandrae TaxID=1761741 RepID=UPI001F09B3DA|nr:hypothetical protein [Paenibacillus periandrae]